MQIFGGTIHESLTEPRPKGYFLPGDVVMDRFNSGYDRIKGVIVDVLDEPDENGDDIVVEIFEIGYTFLHGYDKKTQRFHSGEFIHDYTCDIRRVTEMIEARGFELYSGAPI